MQLLGGCVLLFVLCAAKKHHLNGGSSTGEFVWLTDLHLDVAYHPDKSQHDFCRVAEVSDDDCGSSVLPMDLVGRLLNNVTHLELVKKWTNSQTEIPIIRRDAQKPKRLPLPPREQMPTWETADTSVHPLLMAYHGRYGCDTPPSLMWSVLESIAQNTKANSWILNTGDIAAHYWLPGHRHLPFLSVALGSAVLRRYFSLETMGEIDWSLWDGSQVHFLELIAAALKGGTETTPRDMVMAVGNNDLINDYEVSENAEWNNDLYELWADWLVPAAEAPNFRRGMYYRKKVGEFDVLVLNTVWYHRLATNEEGVLITEAYQTESGYGDPAGQFAWMKAQLDDIKGQGGHVIIVGHVPPSQSLFRNSQLGFTVDSEWAYQWAEAYENLLDPYRDIIKGQLYGHTHTDEFRLEVDRPSRHETNSTETVSTSTEERPDPDTRCIPPELIDEEGWSAAYKAHAKAKGLILIAPSISPNHANNPSWRTVTYSVAHKKQSVEMVGYEQRFGALYGYEKKANKGEVFGTFDNRGPLQLDHSYRSDHTIGPVRYMTARNVQQELDTYILRSEKKTVKWWENQLVYGGTPPAFVIRCVLTQRYVKHDIRKCVRRTIYKRPAAHQPLLSPATIEFFLEY